MWLERILARLLSAQEPVVLVGGEPAGTNFIIDALTKQRRVAWLYLSPLNSHDYIALGNQLAFAVNTALGATLLTQALPYTFSLEILRDQLPRLGELTIACSGADLSPGFADALAKLQSDTCRIILDTAAELGLSVPARVISKAELALTQDEARHLGAFTLSDTELELLYRSTGGEYHTFLSSLTRIRGEPLVVVPHPTGVFFDDHPEQYLQPEELLDTLLYLQRYEEALNLAVLNVPERVPEILAEAGPVYQDKGLLSMLHLLLTSLEDPLRRDETVLEWRFLAGASVGDFAEVFREVEAHLETHDAPELRARYAGALSNMENRVHEAQRAATTRPSPLTLFQLGRVVPDPEEGVKILRDSVRIAELYGRPYEVARNAGALAQRLLESGQFEQASFWSEWALTFFDRHKLSDGNRRLSLLNIWAYSRMIVGQTVGLEPILEDAIRGLEHTELDQQFVIASTLQELKLLYGKIDEAERLARDNAAASPRFMAGQRAVSLVRVLFERGEPDAAMLEGRRALEMTTHESELFALPARLAIGIAQALTHHRDAIKNLRTVMEATFLPYEYRLSAALYLAYASHNDLSVIPSEVLRVLHTVPLGGLRVLSGPSTQFAPLWQKLQGEEAPLRLAVLGKTEVVYEGKPLDLSLRLLEILVLLALNPNGLSVEQLHDRLYRDDPASTPRGLNVSVSRLRKLLPVSSQPLKLGVPVHFDVETCQRLLQAGQLRDALELYYGPLLPESDAPGIAEARHYLDERIRQAALEARDPEVLFALGEALGSDEELWRVTLEALSPGDPRVAQVKARLATLESFDV